jgi:integrase
MAKQTLTDRTIKAIKPAPAGQRIEIWDAVVPGLGVRTTDRGAKSFVLATRYPGSTNPARRALGAYGELTLEQARTKARQWLDLIGRGIDPQAEIERQRLNEQRKRAGTFAALVEDFVREKLPTERRGRNAELHLRGVFLPRWGDRPVTEITPADVKAIVREVKAEGKPTQAHALLATVRRLFNWAIEQDDYGLEHSPCDHIKAKSLIGQLRSRSRVLSDDEIRAFWRACDRLDYPRGAIGKLILLTGARHREAAWAPWSEFDLAGAMWKVDAKRFKSAFDHLVPLSPDALQLLQSLPRFRAGSYLFSVNLGRTPTEIDERVKPKLDCHMLRTLRAMARIRGEDLSAVVLKPWVIHDLRRTVRTHLAALRVPDHVAEMVLGHGRKGLQRVYDLHRYETELREALTLWAARLRSILEPPPANVVPLRGSAS